MSFHRIVSLFPGHFPALLLGLLFLATPCLGASLETPPFPARDIISHRAGSTTPLLARPDSIQARDVLDRGLVEAERTDRLVFLHSGADW